MSNAILFLGWNRPHHGHEDATYKWLMSEVVPSLKKWEGKWFDRVEACGLTPHGGDLNGFFILFGQRAKLDELRRTDEFEAFSMGCGKRLTNWGVIPGVNFEGMTQVMKRVAP
jgi:hypothetical protein